MQRAVAENLLLSHQFSVGIKGGVQQVILVISLSLQLNPDFSKENYVISSPSYNLVLLVEIVHSF